uniref:Uncharacterized protein n=1 Tax=Leersia perrieri TaxID=77586 RepID=A0A0D9XZK3_9ORYZ
MSSTRVAADAATGGSCSLCHHGLAVRVYPPPYLPPPPQEERRRWRGRSWLDSFKHGAANEGGRNSVDLAFYYGQSYYMDHRQNNDQYHNSNLQQASDDDFDIE